ncbi:hypothetical protein CO181_01625 [candidate division WWE3 bacterium CG_4_9_14_3_um_filter_43_9]|uniref:Uncharacterized protein n=1 Tax=candidate division WWE3 bacterium CG_4_9_14_3_um_filter_43_9 TaxID=1975082 RepID=A0A2M7WY23_UNCKA|nr:MAG: hypothetical protein CO181_01625 [candidate division WWE3 bacterium CG_4_9_14_3_um_filter_43_9]
MAGRFSTGKTPPLRSKLRRSARKIKNRQMAALTTRLMFFDENRQKKPPCGAAGNKRSMTDDCNKDLYKKLAHKKPRFIYSGSI